MAAVLGACFATAGWTGAWQKPTTPVASPAADRLNAVAALGESDAWAVGTRYLSSHGGVFLTLIEHWDGKNWNVVPSPSPEGIGEQTASILGAVAIDSPNDIWAVGSRSSASTDPRKTPPSHGLIEHWNGVKWTVVPGPRSGGRTTGLTAVATLSRTAAWAIGDGTAGGHEGTVFMRWDGTRWRYLPSPAGTNLSGLVAISAHDIWVVGTKLTPKSKPAVRTLAEHWNGSKWTIVPTPNGFKGRTRNSSLFAADGSSSSSVWAVGSYQSGPTSLDRSTLVEHWGGARWRVQPSPNGPGSPAASRLDAIAVLSRTSAWAVGSYDSNHGLAPLTERWNGVRWTVLPSQLQPGVTFAFLSGVAVIHARYAWAVGEALNQDRHPITLIEKWNGASWQQVPSPNP